MCRKYVWARKCKQLTDFVNHGPKIRQFFCFLLHSISVFPFMDTTTCLKNIQFQNWRENGKGDFGIWCLNLKCWCVLANFVQVKEPMLKVGKQLNASKIMDLYLEWYWYLTFSYKKSLLPYLSSSFHKPVFGFFLYIRQRNCKRERVKVIAYEKNPP